MKRINIKKIVSDKKIELLVSIFSLLILIVGSIFLGVVKALIIVLVLDLIIFLVFMKKRSNKKNKKDLKSKNSKKKVKKFKVLKIIITIILGFIILCILAVSAFFYMIVKEAPEFDAKNLYKSPSTILYDKNGEIITKLGSEKRENITYDQVPEVLVDAIIATEDSRFFEHSGVDLLRFIKASIYQVMGRDAGGASTLTMQISKKNYTSDIASGFEGIKRKFTDIYMSVFKIEPKYTKQQIFEFYINSNALGAGSYGVEQACLTYFGKSAKDINLSEAALIAGLFQAPSAYNPYVNPDAAEARREEVLSLMERHGYITSEEHAIASAIKVEDLLKKTSDTTTKKYQDFVDTVVEEVEDLTGFNPYTTSMQIYTTMDRAKQEHIDSLIDGTNFNWENDYVNTGISVIDVKSGAIVAIGAGRNRTGERSFNVATMISRQIGSTSKPLYDYGPGIEYNNWSTYQPFVDEGYSYSNGTKINNWDGRYQGLLTARIALAGSRNIPALKAFQSVENANIKNFVTNLGLSPEVDNNGFIHEAHSIGAYNGESPLTMSAAYAAFANGGYYIKPYSFTKIVYRDTGEVYENKINKKRAMSEETAYMITDMLKTTAPEALGSTYSKPNGLTICAKTGTTNYDEATIRANGLGYDAINDLWVVGYDSDYSIAVWYGYNSIISDYYTSFGSQQHSKLFYNVAQGIMSTGANFTKPAGVLEVTVERETYPAALPSSGTPSNMLIKELFKKGTEPTQVSSRFATLSNVTGLNGNSDGKKVTLSWTGISLPDMMNESYIRSYLSPLYKTTINSAVNSRMYYNNTYIGSLCYDIYSKDSNGNLKYIGSTVDNKYTFESSDAVSNGIITYVVKSSYTISKASSSSGAEIKIKFGELKSVITSELNGQSTIDLKVGDKYDDLGVIVLENESENITNSSITTLTAKGETTGKTFTSKTISDITLSPDTYIITYKVIYQDYTETLTRKVIVTE